MTVTLETGEERSWRVTPPPATEAASDGGWLFTAEQRGVDVEVTVAPAGGGGPVVAVDGPYDRRGVEAVLLPRPETGGTLERWVTLRAREPGAPAGRVVLRVEPITDMEEHAAFAAVQRAGEAYRRAGSEDRRQALESYLQAADALAAAGRIRWQARCLYAAAVLARLADENRRALELTDRVLPLWRELGEPFWQASTRVEAGLNHWLLGDPEEARRQFSRARELQHRHGEAWGEAVAAANLCLMRLVVGELRAGAECYEDVLPRLRAVQAAQLTGAALTNLGRVWDLLGEPQRSRRHYRDALDHAAFAGHDKGRAQVLNNLAALEGRMGERRAALEHYAEALEIFDQLEETRWRARVLTNLGFEYLLLGELERAEGHLLQGLGLWRRVEDPAGRATALLNLGLLRVQRGDGPAARELFQRVLELRREAEDRTGEAWALLYLGVARAMAEAPEARSTLEEAVARFEQMGHRHGSTLAHLKLAQVALDRKEPREVARRHARAALDGAREVGSRPRQVEALEMLARVASRHGHEDEARRWVAQGLELAETLRTELDSPDLRAALSARGHSLHALGVELWMEAHRRDPAAGHDATALELAERGRARTLVELLQRARAEPARGIDGTLVAERREILQRLSVAAAEVLEPGGEVTAAAAAEERRLALLARLDAVEAEIGRSRPRWNELLRPSPLRLEDLRGLLAEERGPADGHSGTWLLEYFLGEETSYLWRITADGLTSWGLPPRAEIEAAVRRLHGQLAEPGTEDRRAQAREAATLARILLGPLAVDWRNGPTPERIVVVPDGALHYLPFAVLPGPGETGLSDALVDRVEILQVPSAAALVSWRRREGGSSGATASVPRPVAVFADPVPPRGEPRLPASRREARAVAEVFTAQFGSSATGALFLGPEASRQRLMEEDLRRYGALHFATHGLLDAERPALSGLRLSVPESGDENAGAGFLGLQDVYNLGLAADLVVLSGCRTALGREMRGEGLVGLARGFLYAGASRVLASLWRVEDQATAELMVRFYRGLWQEGLAPAAALARAQSSIASERRWRDPYYWAGWVLVGDWRG